MKNDKGAIGALIGILLGTGVLFGFAVLAIDTGQLYVDRAELQTGADAGAVAVARSCALGLCDTSKAQAYADANAKDDDTTVDLVCGRSSGLSSCPSSSGALKDCPDAPTSGGYVDVHVSTVQPPAFARAIGADEATVHACSRAAWGGPATATTAAFTISHCEWKTATADGASYGTDRVMKLRATGVGTCPAGPAGSDAAGVFGWTVDPTSTCATNVATASYGASTSASAGQSCRTLLADAQSNHKILLVPVYSGVVSGNYQLVGFASFQVTGYRFSGFNASDWKNPSLNCPVSQQCLNGYFVKSLIPVNGTIGGVNLGTTEVLLTG